MGHVQAERLCSLEIYNQLELGRLLYRQITGLLAVQNSIYVTCRLSKLISYNPSYGLLNKIVRVRRGIVSAACDTEVSQRYSRQSRTKMALLDFIRRSTRRVLGMRAQGEASVPDRYEFGRKVLPARPAKAARIVPEHDWPADWREERRLVLMFQPRIRQCGKVIEEEWMPPRVPSRVDVTTRLPDLDPCAAWRPKELTSVVIEPSAPWDGSRFIIEESSVAQELGLQMFSPNTPVFGTVSLAVPAFDYLKDKLQDDGRTGRILLACGFPTGDIAIPRPRPVQRDERIPNPVAIYRKTPRAWFEIVSVAEPEPGSGQLRMESLARWMAVED